MGIDDARRKMRHEGQVIQSGLAGGDIVVLLGALILTAKEFVGFGGVDNRTRF